MIRELTIALASRGFEIRPWSTSSRFALIVLLEIEDKKSSAAMLPLEPLFQQIPGLGKPPAELLFVDADAPTATSYTEPYGVVLAFTRAGAALADEYRDRWELPRGADSRPAYDPYGL
jgi:hypothetical protein